MPNGTYGGVRGRKTKVGRKLLRFPPTRLMERGDHGGAGRDWSGVGRLVFSECCG